MIGSSRIGLRQLAQLSRRVGTALGAGVDARRVWAREAESGSAANRSKLQRVSQAVNGGDSIHDALGQVGGYFPVLFREMVNVGETTGKLDRVLLRLAEHYEQIIRLKRTFLIAIAWPVIQAIAAVFIVGLLIAALGWVEGITGERQDILGFGLVGTSGVIKYTIMVLSAVAIACVVYAAVRRGATYSLLMRMLVNVPVVGAALRTMAISRLAWTLALSIDSGTDARTAVSLAIQSTHNGFFIQHKERIDKSIRQGREINEALRDTHAFPQDLLDAVEVGEQTGRLTESLETLSDQYHDRAKAAATALAAAATMLVWACVFGVLIFLILRLAMFYIGTLYDALEGF